MSEILEFLRGVFTGLADIVFNTNDTKVLYIFVAPILFCTSLVVLVDFIIPAVTDIRISRESWKTFAWGIDFNKSVLDKRIESQFVRFGEFGDLHYDSVNGITKLGFYDFIKHPFKFGRWLGNRKRLEESVVREKMLNEYREEFENIYGIAPNNKQLEMFIMQEGKREWRRKRSNTRARLGDTIDAELFESVVVNIPKGSNISINEQIPSVTSASLSEDLNVPENLLEANNNQLKN